MKTKLYVDKGEPLVSCWPERLSDGSEAWNIHFRGGESVACMDEKRADTAFGLIAMSIEIATGERPLIL